MISSEALHIGPIMLPWTLVFLILALIAASLVGRYAGKQLKWPESTMRAFQDSIWSSVWIGMIAARVVFILLHAEAYFAAPIDMLKIQDKGFHLLSGVVFGALWFFWKNKALALKAKIILLFTFTVCLGIGLGLQAVLQKETHYPDLKFTPLATAHLPNSTAIALNQFKGQPTVVNLWASWCPPCHREMPVLAKAQQQHADINFVLLNQGEDVETVQKYLQKNHFAFKHVLFDPNGEMPQQMNTFGLPTTFFFNAQGQLLERHQGELTAAMLQQYLKKISENN